MTHVPGDVSRRSIVAVTSLLPWAVSPGAASAASSATAANDDWALTRIRSLLHTPPMDVGSLLSVPPAKMPVTRRPGAMTDVDLRRGLAILDPTGMTTHHDLLVAAGRRLRDEPGAASAVAGVIGLVTGATDAERFAVGDAWTAAARCVADDVDRVAPR